MGNNLEIKLKMKMWLGGDVEVYVCSFFVMRREIVMSEFEIESGSRSGDD